MTSNREQFPHNVRMSDVDSRDAEEIGGCCRMTTGSIFQSRDCVVSHICLKLRKSILEGFGKS